MVDDLDIDRGQTPDEKGGVKRNTGIVKKDLPPGKVGEVETERTGYTVVTPDPQRHNPPEKPKPTDN